MPTRAPGEAPFVHGSSASYTGPSRAAPALAWALVLTLAGSAGAGSPAPVGDGDRFDVVVIDAGHGGDDDGARGANGVVEKAVVLDVARRLAGLLEARGLEVVLTRKDDRFVPLESRTAIANDARGDLFLSIHANAASSHRPRGIETYFVSLEASDPEAGRLAALENEALGAEAAPEPSADPLAAILGDMMSTLATEESSDFARIAQKELARLDAVSSRGVKQAPFVVLMGVQMPACLVEIGFVTNRQEARALSRASRRQDIAEALAKAVDRFWRRYDARRGIALGEPGPAGAGGAPDASRGADG